MFSPHLSGFFFFFSFRQNFYFTITRIIKIFALRDWWSLCKITSSNAKYLQPLFQITKKITRLLIMWKQVSTCALKNSAIVKNLLHLLVAILPNGHHSYSKRPVYGASLLHFISYLGVGLKFSEMLNTACRSIKSTIWN